MRKKVITGVLLTCLVTGSFLFVGCSHFCKKKNACTQKEHKNGCCETKIKKDDAKKEAKSEVKIETKSDIKTEAKEAAETEAK